MRKVLLLTVLLILGANAWAGHHKNFKTTAYVMVQDVNRLGTVKEWEALWPDYSKNLKLDKVYLETFRDNVFDYLQLLRQQAPALGEFLL